MYNVPVFCALHFSPRRLNTVNRKLLKLVWNFQMNVRHKTHRTSFAWLNNEVHLLWWSNISSACMTQMKFRKKEESIQCVHRLAWDRCTIYGLLRNFPHLSGEKKACALLYVRARDGMILINLRKVTCVIESTHCVWYLCEFVS